MNYSLRATAVIACKSTAVLGFVGGQASGLEVFVQGLRSVCESTSGGEASSTCTHSKTEAEILGRVP